MTAQRPASRLGDNRAMTESGMVERSYDPQTGVRLGR